LWEGRREVGGLPLGAPDRLLHHGGRLSLHRGLRPLRAHALRAEKRIRQRLLHRIAVIGASAGLVTQVVLGFVAARSADAGNARSLETYATVHQAVGYTTLGLMAVAATVWVF